MEVEVIGLNARQTRTLSIWEEHFQHTLDREISVKHENSKLHRFRQACHSLLHSQPILLLVVVLNCVDCILVLSELFLDVYFVKGMIITAESTMETFNQLLVDKYPCRFGTIPVYDTHAFYNQILKARLIWKGENVTAHAPCGTNITVGANVNENPRIDWNYTVTFFEDNDDPAFLHDDVHSTEENIAHALHEISVAILGVLVIFTLLKIFSHGLSFVKHKLEVFDGIVVIALFTLDVCYINGLTNYPVESFLLILAIMIPWRVIRVLNSLVIAVKDNFHFIMKLMFKKNKYLTDELERLKAVNTRKQEMVEILTKLCINRGVTQSHLTTIYEQKNIKKAKTQERLMTIGACFRRQVSDDFPFIQGKVDETESLVFSTCPDKNRNNCENNHE
ncbi:Voltage-gated hydrogen channel 1 [Mactra antiquata]